MTCYCFRPDRNCEKCRQQWGAWNNAGEEKIGEAETTEDKYAPLRICARQYGGNPTNEINPFMQLIADLLSERDALIKEREEGFWHNQPMMDWHTETEIYPWIMKCKYGVVPMTCDYVCSPTTCPKMRKGLKSL